MFMNRTPEPPHQGLRFELWALPRIDPMVAIAFIFAPSASSTEAYWDWTRPSSAESIPESSYGSYWDSGVVALR
jgi:hypothetical protein